MPLPENNKTMNLIGFSQKWCNVHGLNPCECSPAVEPDAKLFVCPACHAAVGAQCTEPKPRNEGQQFRAMPHPERLAVAITKGAEDRTPPAMFACSCGAVLEADYDGVLRVAQQHEGHTMHWRPSIPICITPSPDRSAWLIHFDDVDMDDEVFTGDGAEQAARARYKDLAINWTCQLFMATGLPRLDGEVESRVPGADPNSNKACSDDSEAGNWQAKFEDHTQAVGQFLSELHAIMVDPLAEGSTDVAEMMAVLLKAARDNRQALADQKNVTLDAGRRALLDRAMQNASNELATTKNNGEPPPAHAFEIHISIGANTWRYAQHAAREIADHMDARDPFKGNIGMASGGWDGSHSVDLKRREVTPDQFREELEAWRVATRRGGE